MQFTQTIAVRNILLPALILLSFSTTLKAQCTDDISIVAGISTKTCNCVASLYATYEDTQMNVYKTENMSSVVNMANRFKKMVEDTMLHYAGKTFLRRFVSLQMPEPDSLQPRIPGCDDKTYCDKCYITYHYAITENSMFTFHVSIGQNDKIISAFNFPPKAKYKPTDSTFNYCRLIEIAKKADPGIEPIGKIEFKYDKKRQAFYWMLTQSWMQNITKTKPHYSIEHEVYVNAVNMRQVRVVKHRYQVTITDEPGHL